MSLELPTATVAAAATTATIATPAHRLSEGGACALVLAAGQDVCVDWTPAVVAPSTWTAAVFAASTAGSALASSSLDTAERTPGREHSFSTLISTARLPTMPTVLSSASKGTVRASLTLGAGSGACIVIASHMVEGTA